MDDDRQGLCHRFHHEVPRVNKQAGPGSRRLYQKLESSMYHGQNERELLETFEGTKSGRSIMARDKHEN